MARTPAHDRIIRAMCGMPRDRPSTLRVTIYTWLRCTWLDQVDESAPDTASLRRRLLMQRLSSWQRHLTTQLWRGQIDVITSSRQTLTASHRTVCASHSAVNDIDIQEAFTATNFPLYSHSASNHIPRGRLASVDVAARTVGWSSALWPVGHYLTTLSLPPRSPPAGPIH